MGAALSHWRSLLRPGDYALVVAATTLVIAAYPLLWQGQHAQLAVIRSQGQLIAELPLNQPRTLAVTGPLGITTIEVREGRARVLADPGPRQYCVKQGWLSRPNAIAICAPNQVSLMLQGDKGSRSDTLSY